MSYSDTRLDLKPPILDHESNPADTRFLPSLTTSPQSMSLISEIADVLKLHSNQLLQSNQFSADRRVEC